MPRRAPPCLVDTDYGAYWGIREHGPLNVPVPHPYRGGGGEKGGRETMKDKAKERETMKIKELEEEAARGPHRQVLVRARHHSRLDVKQTFGGSE